MLLNMEITPPFMVTGPVPSPLAFSVSLVRLMFPAFSVMPPLNVFAVVLDSVRVPVPFLVMLALPPMDPVPEKV